MNETESAPVKILRTPLAPTEEEKEQHMVTHTPSCSNASRRYSSYFMTLWTVALVSAVHGFHIHAISVIVSASMLNMNITAHFVTATSTLDHERYELNGILGHPPGANVPPPEHRRRTPQDDYDDEAMNQGRPPHRAAPLRYAQATQLRDAQATHSGRYGARRRAVQTSPTFICRADLMRRSLGHCNLRWADGEVQ